MQTFKAFLMLRKQPDGGLLFCGFTDSLAGFDDPDGIISSDPDLSVLEMESTEPIPPIHMAFTGSR